MIFIGGISSGMRQIEYLKTVICGRCGSYGRYQVYMTYMYFSFFFIPLFKWSKRFYVKMSCCEAVYELNPEVGRRLLRGESIDICEADLTLYQEGHGNPWEHRDHTQEPPRYLADQGRKVCKNCGYETTEEFEFCPKCGSRLGGE